MVNLLPLGHYRPGGQTTHNRQAQQDLGNDHCRRGKKKFKLAQRPFASHHKVDNETGQDLG